MFAVQCTQMRGFFFSVAQQPQSGLGRLFVEALEDTRLDTLGRSLMNE